ncbi:uncharacterized protein LOC129722675 [Wyeomyia smithii]|uniref:uncharacterized protein LOC129722675 n=1 Tax=Wyeomyia smithii TaxID=174621 RepID=UPI002467EA73|nr:uncharacterized protein LOC129722675 [Wyeomyia smithii]XP_055532295.1 uncharacterized protein LOC129722675 [Wyeomyia smithii]XP_055532296.1 uncharacterized protein LOC129722675 [Wyeomyia smithii]XP_055532297.1 uncharacterized protein LOC129722675 [Wyeomyia smithii]XP_055532298.1 uncharacterized protein LOC129722675 [Wyeomyia smithii]
MFYLPHRLIARGLHWNSNFAGRNQYFRLSFHLANQFSGIVQLGAYDRLRVPLSERIAVDLNNSRNLHTTMISGSSSKKITPTNIRVYSLTKNINFYSASRSNWDKNTDSLRLKDQIDKPLVIIFGWLQASEKHLKKFAELYIEQGFEVLVAHLSPWQLIWPVSGSQAVAGDLVKFLKHNDLAAGVVIHGFSVGGYLWGECLVKLNRNETNKQVLNKIKGQIWDSAANITEIPVGVPYAVLPKNPLLQSTLRNYLTYHLKLFHEEATQYYEKSASNFYNDPAQGAALFLVSKTDPVGTESANRRIISQWESIGIKTTLKCWDRSPHVGHFHKHRDEYIDLVLAHLGSLNIAGYVQKAKL